MLDESKLHQLRVMVDALFIDGLQHNKDESWKEFFEESSIPGSAVLYPIVESFLSGYREWVGSREVVELLLKGYHLRNVPYEKSVSISEDDMRDPKIPEQMKSPIRNLGKAATRDIHQRAWEMFTAALSEPCYNGQTMLSQTHPSLDGNGTFTNLFNIGDGQPRWFLVSTNRITKPFVINTSIAPRSRIDDGKLISECKYYFCGDYKAGFGFVLPQLIASSEGAMTSANVNAARVAMKSWVGPDGRAMGAMPNILVVPTVIAKEAREIVGVTNANGGTNGDSGILRVVEHPYL